MAGITNISHSPADKRGMGLTFLGMMKHDDAPVQYNDGEIRQMWVEIYSLKTEVEYLRKQVMTPWYKKAWAAIVRLFKGE